MNRFYNYFEKFQTIKTFSFADVYSSEHENAVTRKYIDRENEKFRA